ncbi:MAG TPA: MOSC domain-containing protein, partial [Pseudogracilibacillus sp.]|nr:MOSC domain-containing protein [Pseudogracilibacillus sp.]
GDRSHAFINHDRFNRHLSAKIIPYLLGYHATYTENVSTHNSPALKITSPQQETFHWDDGFLQHMTERFSLDLSMETLPMDYEGRTAVDEANLLLTTGSSLKALEKLTGDSLDMRRFRPNIVVSLDEEKPFEEKDWLGRALKIGDIEIEVYKNANAAL